MTGRNRREATRVLPESEAVWMHVRIVTWFSGVVSQDIWDKVRK